MHFLLGEICKELYLLDKKELLDEYIVLLRKQAEKIADSTDYNDNMGWALFYSGDNDKALSYWGKFDIGQDRPYNFMFHNANLGVCYGRMGNITKAETQISILSNFQSKLKSSPSSNQFLSGMNAYCIATIQVALGRKAEALVNLQKAIDEGWWFYPNFWKYDIFLKPLFGDPIFEEMVKPKG
jgi:tetratricopeptide (TPR) repeat protein